MIEPLLTNDEHQHRQHQTTIPPTEHLTINKTNQRISGTNDELHTKHHQQLRQHNQLTIQIITPHDDRTIQTQHRRVR
jgi:hypothetical protein